VHKVQFSSSKGLICLARKHVRPPYRRYPVSLLREEANVMEKLDHHHIVKLVGTYCIQTNLYLLLWPVAVCNLDILLADIENLRTGEGDQEDIINRLHALDLTNLDAIKRPRYAGRSAEHRGNCPLQYLRQIMGCITRAVAYCHQADIRHLDLKPSNILLNPGRVYLADFGIAKDVHDRENTMTRGLQGTPKWRAPELHQSKTDWSMKAADIYSLGLILLNISTTVYYGSLDEFDALLVDVSADGRDEKLCGYLRKLEGLALATQEVDDVDAPTFAPKHIIHLASRMVLKDASSRPVIFQVDTELVELGGIDQVYHFPCCKKNSRFVTSRMNAKLKAVAEERNRLRTEREAMAKRLQVLEAKDVTYESRIMHERGVHADNLVKLQTCLDKERAERKRLEGLVAEMQQSRRPTRPGLPRPATIGPSPGGLTMRARPSTHPLPSGVSQQRPPQTFVQQPSPAPSFASLASVGQSPRPTYSQTAAAAVAAKTALTPAVRRDSLIPSPSPSPGAIPPASPSLDQVGFPLRSRPSGSRLPRAVNPATPIRSGTPNLHRDPSSTDSTQYSMTSSVFDRMSLSKASLAETSVAGTPPTAAHSPAMPAVDMRRPRSPTTSVPKGRPPPAPSSPARSEHGLGLGLTDRDREQERRASITSVMMDESGGGESFRDTASVASSSVAGFPPSLSSRHGAMSPVLSDGGASVLSSPRAGFASAADGTVVRRAGGKVPSLPTGKSWADVARREKRRV
jgi:serine/threonine protein kinase